MYKDQNNNNNNDNNSSAYIAQYHRHKGSLGALFNILLPEQTCTLNSSIRIIQDNLIHKQSPVYESAYVFSLMS